MEMRLPAKFGASEEYRTATVNISFFLIVQKLMQSWPHNDNRLWDHIKKLKLDKILVPRGETDEATGLKTLTQGLQQLRERLQSHPTMNRHTNPRVNMAQDNELLNEIVEKDFNDGYTHEQL